MHGVPSNLPLASFVGFECNQIAIGQFQIQFHFAGAGSIFAESRWELRGPAGDVVDGSCDHEKRDCYRVHQIIDIAVDRFVLDPPRSFTLFLRSGHALTIFDDSERFESFSVHTKGGSDYI